jgi:parvulin-like peptidyl-prolyl isomerase
MIEVMNTVLQVNHQSIATDEVLPLLIRYQMLPDLVRELITDQAIASIVCTDDKLTAIKASNHPSTNCPIASPQEELHAIRALKIEKFKQLRWGDQIDLYFVQRQDQLAKVIYSLIRTRDRELLNELYFRITSKEQSFAELARLYSEGTEAQTDGLIGPVELGSYHPAFAHLLAHLPLGQLQSPMQLGEWWVILRIEQRIAAQLDAEMRQRLLNELFEKWRDQRLSRLWPQMKASSTLQVAARR